MTSARIKAVLDLLSRRKVSASMLADIPNAKKITKAHPDDLVMITYSGHGFADRERNFHIFPYDIGKGAGRAVDDSILDKTVSSRELSLWLRDVDAGEMIMIIDACNSAASVEGAGFKPGPMGSRGLGQLAYDKGMRILTASQAESVAMESDRIKHGALTYSLIREGLEGFRADHEPRDNRILVGEWLSFGVARVPVLYAEILNGEVEFSGGGATARLALILGDEDEDEDEGIATIQQPGLFDFTRKKDFILSESDNR